jgi:hypothetical protein
MEPPCCLYFPIIFVRRLMRAPSCVSHQIFWFSGSVPNESRRLVFPRTSCIIFTGPFVCYFLIKLTTAVSIFVSILLENGFLCNAGYSLLMNQRDRSVVQVGQPLHEVIETKVRIVWFEGEDPGVTSDVRIDNGCYLLSQVCNQFCRS